MTVHALRAWLTISFVNTLKPLCTDEFYPRNTDRLMVSFMLVSLALMDRLLGDAACSRTSDRKLVCNRRESDHHTVFVMRELLQESEHTHMLTFSGEVVICAACSSQDQSSSKMWGGFSSDLRAPVQAALFAAEKARKVGIPMSALPTPIPWHVPISAPE